MSLSTGQILNDRYQVTKKIAKTEFGTIYRAWDLRLNMDCLVKEYSDPSPEAASRFSRVASVLGNLTHPGLPRVTDFFNLPDMGAYLVLDYIEGEDLKTMQQRSGAFMPFGPALNWIDQVGDALTHMHKQDPPIVHGNVQPSSIRVTASGKAMLADYGMARILDARMEGLESATTTEPGFSPPECGDPCDLDPQSDIYSLGATLYALLTARVPPDCNKLKAGEALPPDAVHLINQAVMPHISAAISKAMQIEKANRFDSVEEFLTALKFSVHEGGQAAAVVYGGSEQDTLVQPVAGLPLQPGAGAGIPARPGKGPRPRWLLPSIGGTILALICVVVGGFLLYRNYDSLFAPKATDTPVRTNTPTASSTPASSATPTVSATPSLEPTEPSTATPEFTIGSTLVAESDGMVMVYVPAGEFLMGAGPSDPQAEADEKPQHPVFLDAFWIDSTEVTTRMYKLCLDAGVCSRPSTQETETRTFYFGNNKYADFPVVWVTWEEANAYCQWAGRRLPSEAEWEKASRGPDNFIYPWGNVAPLVELNEYLNSDQRIGDTTRVGYFPNGKSVFGLFDMAGNVLEWVADWMGPFPSNLLTNPLGPDTGDLKVVKGGSWYLPYDLARGSNREGFLIGTAYYDLGFRCAQTP